MTQKNLLIRGTLILTISGLLTRLLGFFYRIYLADALGAEALGIYQLVFPLYGLCFTLFAAGNQTALSKLVASHRPEQHRRLLFPTILLSVSVACLLFVLLSLFAPFVAGHFLMESRSAPALKLLSVSFPFCAVTACINGFYYGRKKAAIPAATQFLEQTVRIGVVFAISHFLLVKGGSFTCEMAMLGLLSGEIASMLFSSLSLLFLKDNASKELSGHSVRPHFLPVWQQLLKISLPITGNRFTISLLHSAEAVLLPAFLRLSGSTPAEALALYGILNGMAMPLLFFPSTITNSLSVMLLPAVADATARGQQASLARTIGAGLRYSILISVLCMGIFFRYGSQMGILLFASPTAGAYIQTLSWLCPFLYLNTTLGSVLNGLDRAPAVFLQNVIASSVRILFLLFLVPSFGVDGYLWGMLAGSLCLTLLHAHTLHRAVPGLTLPGNLILQSVLTLLLGLFLAERIPAVFPADSFLMLILRCLFICLLFLLLFLITEKKSGGDTTPP